MKPGHIVALVVAALVLAAALLKRRRLGGERFVIALVVVAGLAVYGSGVLSGLNIQKAIQHLAEALGKWTYLLVGVMAFAETGAFIGLVAPGEFTVILGGVIAGQGTINIFLLIALVWACTLSGDTVSFFLGRRLGRSFLERHGPKLRITPERLAQVDEHFRRRGGATVLVGRFIGFVRPIAPFLAGSSQMEYRRFLPYSVLGTGLWGPGFCLLGYVFWQSFDQVTKVAGRATLIFGAVVVVVVGIWYLRRKLKDPDDRARIVGWLERQGERPLIRPLVSAARPLVRAAAPRMRFLRERLTPGELGLEFTTALAIAAVGVYVFVAYTVTLAGHPHLLTPADSQVLTFADDTKVTGVVDAVKIYTDIGALPTVAVFMAIAALLLALRRRPLEFIALVGGFVILIIAVQVAKTGVDRPRPPGKLVHTIGASFPSGHTAYSTAYVALAVVAARVLPGYGRRALLVLATVLLSVSIGCSRMYLRAHYWSDVAGGWALGAAIFGLAAVIALIVSHVRNTEPARS